MQLYLLHFSKSFGKILPKTTKSYQVSCHNRYFCYSRVTFIEILIKDNNLLWYKSIHIIYRSFQDVLGCKIIKLCIYYTNTNIYLFCKLNLNTTNLKGPVNFKFHKGTIATHSTIADSQHWEFLTFLTFLSSVVLALLMFFSQFMSLWQQLIAIQATCEKTALEVLRHVHLLLKQYIRASS